MSFHEVRFPTNISKGAQGGPERRTDVVVLGSGYEERNSRWANSRRSYNAGYGVLSLDTLHEVVAFFEERRGRLHGFRWRDHADWKSTKPGLAPTALDQVIGSGTGTQAQFQLKKTYGQGFDPWTRVIAKPVQGSVKIARGRRSQAGEHLRSRYDHGHRHVSGGRHSTSRCRDYGGLRIRRPRPLRHRPPRDQPRRLCRRCHSPHPDRRDPPMKTLSAAFEAHLASGATTLAWCWRLTRRDGVIQGFTDHDMPITFDGTVFEAAAGFTASELKSAVGLSVDNLEVTSALSSAHLSEADLAAGRYDDAKVEIFRVNWKAPEQRLLMKTGSLGEVKRQGTAFAAEVRGLAHYLQQTMGRLYQYTCDADLGDARCKVNLASASYSAMATLISAESSRQLLVSGLSGFATDWFTRGLVTFRSGAAAGQKIEIKVHTRTSSGDALELWQPARLPLVPGQQLTVHAGCDKTIETCSSRFANAVNFRGCPHMPGNDFLTRVNTPGTNS